MGVGTYIKQETKIQKSSSEEVTLNWDLRDKKERRTLYNKLNNVGIEVEY